MISWKLETDVNDWVKAKLNEVWLVKLQDFNEESSMSDYLKEALKWAAKTEWKTSFWKPDFHIEKYRVPVIIEDKFGVKKLVDANKDWEIKMEDKSVSAFAVNWAVWYARQMIASGKYSEVFAIWVAWDDDSNVEIKVYYVYWYSPEAIKELTNCKNFSFLENEDTFEKTYQDAQLTEWEKHKILTNSKISLGNYSKKLNKMLHNHDISVDDRVLYVSWMLLSMQDVYNTEWVRITRGLKPEDLEGLQADTERDWRKILNKIETFLTERNIPREKREIMLDSFKCIASNVQRDMPVKLDTEISKLLRVESSVNKQIFTFIYENIFKKLDGFKGHLDVMWELYSSFLKYALWDGKELGIVLTPPYTTKMMCEMIWIDSDSRVLDLTTGSAGFLISAMEMMIEDIEKKFAKGSTEYKNKVTKIKSEQLLGVEKNIKMYTLAATNMILRGDGSSNILLGDSVEMFQDKYSSFNANKFLLNPPFSKDENGMFFFEHWLNFMEKWGLAAIIIQDSAWSGKAIKSNKKILSKHTLVASIKMPTDLFQPMAWVQTSVYVVKVGTPHDYEVPVKFIDFRNDWYKRTLRALQEIDNPVERYEDIIKIYKAWKNAKDLKSEWDLEKVYVEDLITDSGDDWNFDKHMKIDTVPTLEDFKKTVADYLSFEVNQILKGQGVVNPTGVNL